MPSLRSSTIAARRQRIVSAENGSVNGIPFALRSTLPSLQAGNQHDFDAGGLAETAKKATARAISQERSGRYGCISRPRYEPATETFRSRTEAWQEWQGWAFARVRSRSLTRSKSAETSGLSARTRTGADIARICHAEGRGFESHHPLNSLQTGIFGCLIRQQMTFCMSAER
jgi:hypothetical protein